MPYANMDEVNPAIKGIEPPVTLAQANKIAEWADAIVAGKDPPDSPWAVALAQFKELYEVKDDKWVEKPKEESRPRANPGTVRWKWLRNLLGRGASTERATDVQSLMQQMMAEFWPQEEYKDAWPMGFYLDEDTGGLYAVICNEGKLYRVGVQAEGGVVSFGAPVEVEVSHEGAPGATQPEEAPEARSGVRVLRQKDGKLRWFGFTCTAILNHVAEIDSTRFFDRMIERAEIEGYPFYTFYHQGEALRMGTTDTMARDGVVLIESGLLDKGSKLAERWAADVEANPDKWGFSIGYKPLAHEDAEIGGVRILVVTDGRQEEVSAVLKSDACSLHTAANVMEVNRMNPKAEQVLRDLFRDDPKEAERLIAASDGINRIATDLVTRGVANPSPATETPAKPTEPAPKTPVLATTKPVGAGEVERELELDGETVAAIAAVVAASEPLAGLDSRIKALERGLTELKGGQETAIKAASDASQEARARLEALEKDDEEKHRQWIADLPAKHTTVLRVTERPSKREPESEAEESMALIADRNLKAKGLVK